ncbi:MAG: CBS domain-containing protein [Pseudonocardiaceae bacterium]
MATTVAEVMTTNPVTVNADAPISEAARQMRINDVGDVLIVDNERLIGIITDRDIAVRAVADNKAPSTPVREVCIIGELVTVTPDTEIEKAVQLMRTKALRRLPVVEGARPVGVVSIGDLAIEYDKSSALADISAADPTR